MIPRHRIVKGVRVTYETKSAKAKAFADFFVYIHRQKPVEQSVTRQHREQWAEKMVFV